MKKRTGDFNAPYHIAEVFTSVRKYLNFAIMALLLVSVNFAYCDATENFTFEEERERLHKAILDAEKQGIGTKNYLSALKEIEQSAKKGSNETAIRTRLKQLKDTLDNQLKAAGSISFRQSLHGKRELTEYCQKVEKMLSMTFSPLSKVMNEHCDVCLTVLADGTISKLRLSPDDDCKKATQTLVLSKLTSLRKLIPPPKAPLDLNITVCEKPEHLECSYAGEIEYGPYMNVLQNRIRSKWQPPKDQRNSKIKVIFELLRNGCIQNEKIVTGSHDPKLDQVALETLRTCSPFPKLPDGSPKSVSVQFTFQYNSNR